MISLKDKNDLPTTSDTILTEEQRKAEALKLHEKATGGLFEHLYVLKEINDNKYFIELGFESMAEYCKRTWDYAASTLKEYLLVSNRLLPTISASVNRRHGVYIEDQSSVQRIGLTSLPLKKLIILSQLEQSQLSKFAENGTIRLRNNIYTLADIKEMDRDSLRSLVNGEKRVVVKKEAETKDKIPFEKVYKNAEKHFTKLLLELYKCDLIVADHKKEIDIHLRRAIHIYDLYKETIAK